MQHGCGGECCRGFFFCAQMSTKLRKFRPIKLSKNIVLKCATHSSEIRSLKRSTSPTFSAPLTFLPDTGAQRHQHQPHTTAENLCLKLQSVWWGFIDSCQDDVPTSISCWDSKKAAKTFVKPLVPEHRDDSRHHTEFAPTGHIIKKKRPKSVQEESGASNCCKSIAIRKSVTQFRTIICMYPFPLPPS